MKKTFEYRSEITLAEGKISDIEVLRTGIIQDRGLKITRKMLEDYIANFKDNVYGTELQVNLEHNRGSEAAGWIKNLYISDHKDTGVASLMAKVEWTEMGQDKVSKNLFKFVSAELASDYPHHKTGKLVKNVFIGLALTNTPALKNQQPVTLSEVEEKLFINTIMIKTFLAELKKREFVSKADKELAKNLLAEANLADGDEKTAAEADVAEINKKPEAPEPKKEDLKEKKDVETLTEQQRDEKLAEVLASNVELKEKLERRDLGEVVSSLLLEGKKADATGRATGLAGEKTKETAVSFMLGLTPEQRETFKTLIGAVKTVDLSVKGGVAGKDSAEGEPDADDELAEKVVKLATKLMSKDKTLDVETAQKQAMKKLTEEDAE